MTAQYNSYTDIAEQRDVLNDLTANEAQGPADHEYLEQVGQELDTAKAALQQERSLGKLVLTNEGTIEPADRMQERIRSGEYEPPKPSVGRGE